MPARTVMAAIIYLASFLTQSGTKISLQNYREKLSQQVQQKLQYWEKEARRQIFIPIQRQQTLKIPLTKTLVNLVQVQILQSKQKQLLDRKSVV